MSRFILLVLFAAAAAAGDPFDGGGKARVALVARHETVRPDGTARVAVRFELEEGWHVYWKNPGDSGLAPAVTWTLPEGFTVSDLVWPAPRRLPQGPLTMYGYEGVCLLAADVRIPEGFRGRATIRAHVSWLVCKDVCLQGERDLALELRVSPEASAADPRWKADFARHDRRSPAAPPKGALRAAADGDRVLLAVRRDALGPDPKPSFFPGVEGVWRNGGRQQAKPGDGEIRLALTPADGVPDRVAGLLVFETRTGRRAWRVDLKIRKDQAAKRGKEKTR